MEEEVAPEKVEEDTSKMPSAPTNTKGILKPPHHHHSTPASTSSSRQALCRRVKAVIMGVIIPIGKSRKGLNRSRICLGGSSSNKGKEDHDVLPKKVSFTFTERDALRRIVRRMIQVCVFVSVMMPMQLSHQSNVSFHVLQDCPKMCSSRDRDELLVSVTQLLEETLQEEQVLKKGTKL